MINQQTQQRGWRTYPLAAHGARPSRNPDPPHAVWLLRDDERASSGLPNEPRAGGQYDRKRAAHAITSVLAGPPINSESSPQARTRPW